MVVRWHPEGKRRVRCKACGRWMDAKGQSRVKGYPMHLWPCAPVARRMLHSAAIDIIAEEYQWQTCAQS